VQEPVLEQEARTENGEKAVTLNTLAHQKNQAAVVASDFLRNRFRSAPANLYILVWCLLGKQSYWVETSCLDRLESWIAPFCSPRAGNVYAGVSLSPRDFGPDKRCVASETAAITGLWADIDIAGPEHKAINLPQNLRQAESLASSTGLPPTMVVFSGHGIQPYWEFSSPWVFRNDAERLKAGELSRRFHMLLRKKSKARGWQLDGTHDLPRILRLPGTWNCKGKKPVQVRVMDGSGQRYRPGDFLAILGPDDNAPACTRPKVGLFSEDAVAERARKYIAKMPAAVSGQNGHDATWAVAQTLMRGFSLSIDQARPIIEEFSARCVPPWSDKDLTHKLVSARDQSRLPAGYLLRKTARPPGT
jgi:hypothetical protein